MSGNVSRRSSGEWQYRFDIEPDPLTGRRRRLTKSGFTTKRQACLAMSNAITAHEQGRHVNLNRRSVEDFVNEWHTAIKSALRPTTWVDYRNHLDAYVIPVVGQTALQYLTALPSNSSTRTSSRTGGSSRRADWHPRRSRTSTGCSAVRSGTQ